MNPGLIPRIRLKASKGRTKQVRNVTFDLTVNDATYLPSGTYRLGLNEGQ
jgi:hypothetical protein